MFVAEIGILFAIAVAAVLHGMTGMAFPMIGTAALALLMPLPQAVAILALPSLLMSLLVLCRQNHGSFWGQMRFYWQKYRALFVSSVVGSALGVQLLLWLPLAWLYLLMSAVTFYYVLTAFWRPTPVRRADSLWRALGFGFAAGLIGSATNAMSPILLMYLFAHCEDKDEVVKASNVCFLLSKVLQMGLLWQQFADFNAKDGALTLAIALVAMVFLFVGMALRARIGQLFFRRLILGILLVLAIKVGYSGWVLLG